MKLDEIQALHPNCKVEQWADDFFIVEYPVLQLAVSFTSLIAWQAGGYWHAATGRNYSPARKEHKRILMEKVDIKYWHNSKNDLIDELRRYMD